MRWLLALMALMVSASASANPNAVPVSAQLTPATQVDDGGFFERAISRLSSMPGFSCHFVQVMMYTDGGGQSYAGDVAVKKPKRFRWQYQKPYEQLYIGDGAAIWHYEPDLMQAERLTDLEQVDPAVMKLLDGRIGPSELKLLDHESSDDGSLRRYQISIEGSEPVWFGFTTSGDLVQIERRDQLGNINRMKLSECSYVAPSDNLFSFTPPQGVDVIDMRAAGGL